MKPDAKSYAQQKIQQVLKGTTQLPLWRDDRRAMPNELARSALFTCANHTVPRLQISDKAPLASMPGFDLRYGGEELRQDDLDVWMQLTLMLRGQDTATQFAEFVASSMLTLLDWGTGAKSYERLRASMDRLTKGKLTITCQDAQSTKRIVASLLLKTVTRSRREALPGAPRELWLATLDREIVQLFNPVNMTLVDWELRKQLNEMGKWLHTFYASHAEPLPFKVATLRDLCGSRNANIHSFRTQLRRALSQLVALGFLHFFEIERGSDLVRVHRA